jgi:hypothetical protein
MKKSVLITPITIQIASPAATIRTAPAAARLRSGVRERVA